MGKSAKSQIVFIIPALQFGGAERVLHEIVENLNPQYFECHIIILKRWASCAFEFKRSTHIHHLDEKDYTAVKKKSVLRALAVIKSIFRLRKLLNSFPRSTILVPFFARPTTAYVVLAQLGSGRRIFSSLHTTESEYMKFNYRSHIQRRLEEFLLKIACRGSDKIIAASKGVKMDLVNNFSVSAPKIKVIDNPVDLAKIYRMKTQTPTFELHEPSTKTIFVHIGRLSVEKNHRLLIKAAAILNESGGDFVILIAGEGNQELNIRGWIQDAGLQNRVVMLGSVNNPYALMARARALILTSHYDSSPMVLKEAIASGTAVISVDCPHGPADITQNGKYGMLVPPNNPQALADAMAALAKDDRLFKELVRKGQKRAITYDIEAIIPQWEKVFLQTQ